MEINTLSEMLIGFRARSIYNFQSLDHKVYIMYGQQCGADRVFIIYFDIPLCKESNHRFGSVYFSSVGINGKTNASIRRSQSDPFYS